DFGYWQPNIPEVDVNIANGVPVCNRDFRVHILLRNKSPYATLGHFVLHFNDQLTLIQSSIPYSQLSAGQIIFEDLTIEPLGILVITLDFTAPGFTTEGIALFFNGIYSTSDGVYEGITLDTVVCSYDPNDKKVEATGDFIDDYSLIADPLKYTIRFQNEGTYKAFDITIIDTLDQLLDPSTFELVASSHDVEATITTSGIITFVFRNIDLPTRSDDDLGSQGFVSFTVKPDHELTGLVSIRNKASIYFDFNPPIVTNIAHWHVVDDLAIVSTKEVYAHMSVYPNPTQGTLYLTIDKEADYTIWDCAGRHVDAGILQPGSNSIHLDVPYGIYYLQVRDGDQVFAPVKVAVIR
ncbi:MAG TPA: T9SS type A sorting domain-containing protein, partial [Saprospiraceae bacterium]|nr:T9SS type A sorting domain-containing protein [Saprospiraceae bacterium]